jgi:hypothetical protein
LSAEEALSIWGRKIRAKLENAIFLFQCEKKRIEKIITFTLPCNK